MPIIAVAVAAIIALILGFAHANYSLCDTAACKDRAQNVILLEKQEREFALQRSKDEAKDRFEMEKAERATATRAQLAQIEATKVATERAYDLEEKKLQLAAETEKQKNFVKLEEVRAKAVYNRESRRPRSITNHYLVGMGRGQPRGRCCGYRGGQHQPRERLVVSTGYPGGQQRYPR